MSTKKVNKIYTKTLNNGIVRLILDRSLTKAMDKAIINNNNKGMSLNVSQMKEDYPQNLDISFKLSIEEQV